ncbi:methylamine utilization protein MauD [Nocardiopsis sp. TSRI0078]|uniref:MauE/DoxX family redox-associated membrane protein n=1 Tax=unclassified Nocardiopsis TaxID=2649073 RepID=UPI00093CAF67|nr:MauE/DoxX family redox-associated membrane protein [Nocardiopsis sp. TSRI0078]OKI23898.1 methylamine utilization protein MauD [Nocardiopsis sp. TSRI0078]
MLPEIVEAAREVQLPLLAVLLLLGAVAKTARGAADTGLAVLVPERLRRPSTVGTGLVEAALAVGLLALGGLLGEVVRMLTAVVFAVSVVVLVLVRRRDPEAGCGCFGGLSRTPVGWRALTRAGLLSAAALATLGLEPAGWQAAASAGPLHAGVLGAELLLLVLLSPELRDVAARPFHREPCELREVSLRRTTRVLRRSEVWRINASVMTGTEPEDVWRQGCWRLLRYDGMRHGRRVDVVYAVRLGGRRDAAVRAVLVDRGSGAVVASFGAVTRTTLPGAPHKLPHPRRAARQDAGRYDADRAARTLRAARAHPAGGSPEPRDLDGRGPDGREPTPAG